MPDIEKNKKNSNLNELGICEEWTVVGSIQRSGPKKRVEGLEKSRN